MTPPHPIDVLDSAAKSNPDEVVVVTKIAGKIYVRSSAYPEIALDYSEALH